MNGIEKSYSYGDTLTMELEPKEIRVLNFDKNPRDWGKLRALQVRTPYTPPAKDAGLILIPPPKNHKIIGVWEYKHAGSQYSREFTDKGLCVLRKGKSVEWKKAFKVKGNDTAMVGSYPHVIQDDGTLLIENKYKAAMLKKHDL